MLLQSQATETSRGEITKFGAENITNIHQDILNGLNQWDSSIIYYNPLIEIAKLAYTTDSDDLKFKCHQEIAKYLHPQVSALQIQSKDSKEIKITVEIADYAKKPDYIIEPEDIEVTGEIDADEVNADEALELDEEDSQHEPIKHPTDRSVDKPRDMVNQTVYNDKRGPVRQGNDTDYVSFVMGKTKDEDKI